MLLSKDKEIDAFKRNILQSEEKHEKLSYMMSRVNNDIGTSKKAIAKTRRKFDELKITYAQKTRVLHAVESVYMQTNSVRTGIF